MLLSIAEHGAFALLSEPACMSWHGGRRAQHAQAEQTLAGRSHEGSKSPAASSTLSPEIDSPSAPHFVAECFFLAQQAVHTCLMPAGKALPPAELACHAAAAAAVLAQGTVPCSLAADHDDEKACQCCMLLALHSALQQALTIVLPCSVSFLRDGSCLPAHGAEARAG